VSDPKPPGLHPLAWEYLCSCVRADGSDGSRGVAWYHVGRPLLDEGEPPQAAVSVRYMRAVIDSKDCA
jgi:hypothetical protein